MTLPNVPRGNALDNHAAPETVAAAQDAPLPASAVRERVQDALLVSQPNPIDYEATRTRFSAMTGIQLCSWQALVTFHCNTGDKHVFMLAPCGSGKTMAFLATLLFNTRDIIIIVSPLLSLGQQHVQNLLKLGISAVELSSKTISNDLITNLRLLLPCYRRAARDCQRRRSCPQPAQSSCFRLVAAAE